MEKEWPGKPICEKPLLLASVGRVEILDLPLPNKGNFQRSTGNSENLAILNRKALTFPAVCETELVLATKSNK